MNDAKARALRALAAMTDEEDAAITAAAEADPDNPPLTEADWAAMRPADKVIPEVLKKAIGR